MTKLKRRFGALPLAALALLVVGGVGVFAQRNYMIGAGQPEVKIVLAGAVERGQERVALDKAGEVRPGEVLAWTITSQNDGTGAAREYKATGQIPQGTIFIAGSTSADGAASVTYSIDHGKSFTAQPTIEERQADGSTKRVPAPVAMYTQVRYEWSDALAAGSKLAASYKVRVK
ncbi:MAG TPA: hypothetical protein VF525_09695 [Pyrinomonadaceae bacterium]|jgi:uncharacterized repeat protein (TIGR01451 family)